jgi:NAD(P)-dependent dehydrogenase (short-subunit alcohol dehydrogenase family)
MAQAHGVKAIAIQADVSQLDEAERLLQQTLEHFGRIDFLICNAGIWEGGPVESLSEELWDKTLDINLKGTWSVCRAAVPLMKKQKFGRIVIVSLRFQLCRIERCADLVHKVTGAGISRLWR